MHCKSGLIDNGNGEVVGWAHDAFEESAIKMELAEIKACDRTEQQLEEQSDATAQDEVKTPKLTKQFQVFMATSWSPTDERGVKSKHEFVVARYGLKSVSSEFLIPALNDIMVTLWFYGFIVNDIVGDGASENRTTFKHFANISARDILCQHFDANTLKGLPLDFNVAFKHPVEELGRDGVIVFIGGEMPHWVKKFRNAFDNKKKKLTFRGQSFSLQDFREIWEAIGDGDVSTSCNVRLFKFTLEHFILNSYNKMRVYLAVQIPSLTMIEMIEYACSLPELGLNSDDYSAVIEVFRHVNRLVDIMNGKNKNDGKILNVEKINSPTHPHNTELLNIL
eukprot:scaffold201889_cov63-Cyclotella_meneghiniana.AAC.1